MVSIPVLYAGKQEVAAQSMGGGEVAAGLLNQARDLCLFSAAPPSLFWFSTNEGGSKVVGVPVNLYFGYMCELQFDRRS